MDLFSEFSQKNALQAQFVFNLMQMYQNSFKFFDIRTLEDFNSCALRSSLHVLPDRSLYCEQYLKHLTKEKELSRLRRFCLIIGFESPFQVEAETFKTLLEGLKCREIHKLETVNDFLLRYPFLCSSFRHLSIKEFPNEIIPNFLYLGSLVQAHNREVIETLKITHICNVTRAASNLFPNIKYCRVFVEDSETEKISLFFQRAFEFIEEAWDTSSDDRKNVVLVHCAQGKSRSATIVIMYLMRAYGKTLEQAFQFTKKHRDIIEPNEGFVKELMEFEACRNQFFRRASTVSLKEKKQLELYPKKICHDI